MTSKDWKWIAIACLLVLVAYQAGKYAGKNSAESRSRESELAFQKEKEATRKDEFAKEKQAMEKRRIEDAREARDLAAMQSFTQSQDRQMALAIQAMQALSQRGRVNIPTRGGGPTQSQDRQMAILREYLESLQNIQRQPSR